MLVANICWANVNNCTVHYFSLSSLDDSTYTVVIIPKRVAIKFLNIGIFRCVKHAIEEIYVS